MKKDGREKRGKSWMGRTNTKVQMQEGTKYKKVKIAAADRAGWWDSVEVLCATWREEDRVR